MTSSFAVASPTNLFDNGYVTDKTNYLESNPFSRWVFTTKATHIFIKCWDTIYGTFPAWAHVDIWVNGESYTVLATAALGLNILQADLPVGIKTIELIPGLQSRPGARTDLLLGVFLKSVYLSGGGDTNQASPTLPDNRMVIYGDSIAVGASATYPTNQGWQVLMRSRITTLVEAFGNRGLWNDAYDDGSDTSFAALIAAYFSGIAGRKVFWLCVGTNDYGLNRWTADAFGVALADFLDKLHTADATIEIWCQTPITRANETDNNAGGDNLLAYRTQMVNVCSSRAWSTLVDGTAILAIGDISGDGVHPTVAGHAKYAAAVKTILGI